MKPPEPKQTAVELVVEKKFALIDQFSDPSIDPEMKERWVNTFDANQSSVEDRINARTAIFYEVIRSNLTPVWFSLQLQKAMLLSSKRIGKKVLLKTVCSHCGSLIERLSSGKAVEEQHDTIFYCKLKCMRFSKVSGYKKLTSKIKHSIEAKALGSRRVNDIAAELNVSPNAVAGFLQVARAEAERMSGISYSAASNRRMSAAMLDGIPVPKQKKPISNKQVKSSVKR